MMMEFNPGVVLGQTHKYSGVTSVELYVMTFKSVVVTVSLFCYFCILSANKTDMNDIVCGVQYL